MEIKDLRVLERALKAYLPHITVRGMDDWKFNKLVGIKDYFSVKESTLGKFSDEILEDQIRNIR